MPTRAFVITTIGAMVASACVVTGQPANRQANHARDLLTSARRGDLQGLGRALTAGAAVDVVDPNFQQTALMRAAMFDKPAAVAQLLKAGAVVGRTSNLKRTALHWAAIGRSPESVRLLLKAGAEVDAIDADGEIPLGLALDVGSQPAVQALLDAGADAARSSRSLAARLSLVLGNAVQGEPREALRRVIRHGRGLETDDGTGRTALLVAASWAHLDGSAEIARDLLASGARREARGPDGRTAVEDVRARLPRETRPAYRANVARMLAVLEPGAPR